MTPPSPAVREKVKDYVLAGRVRILTAAATEVDARVLGSSPDPYIVGYDREHSWFCGCPAVVPACSHVLAVALVWRPGLYDERAAFLDLDLSNTTPARGLSARG